MNMRKPSYSDSHECKAEGRPAIILTMSDRDKLLALVRKAPASARAGIAEFLREEVERAEIPTGDVAPTSVVRMGSDVKFVDHDDGRIHRAKLVFPEEADGTRCISILSSVGSALIGLGPGQSIRWTELGRERSLSVLEVYADEGVGPTSQRRRG
jgi:regulator of nucleoside diphosphate kinase